MWTRRAGSVATSFSWNCVGTGPGWRAWSTAQGEAGFRGPGPTVGNKNKRVPHRGACPPPSPPTEEPAETRGPLRVSPSCK